MAILSSRNVLLQARVLFIGAESTALTLWNVRFGVVLPSLIYPTNQFQLLATLTDPPTAPIDRDYQARQNKQTLLFLLCYFIYSDRCVSLLRQ